MIIIYGMSICPDCAYLDDQIKGDSRFEMRYFEDKTSNLKEFLKIRENNPLFDTVKENGSIGIPCFLLEDGTVTLIPEEVGLKSRPEEELQTCSFDGNGC